LATVTSHNMPLGWGLILADPTTFAGRHTDFSSGTTSHLRERLACTGTSDEAACSNPLLYRLSDLAPVYRFPTGVGTAALSPTRSPRARLARGADSTRKSRSEKAKGPTNRAFAGKPRDPIPRAGCGAWFP
jgi:hypothetical protein